MCINEPQIFGVYFVEEAVPKIHPIQLKESRHGEKVLLKCDASYRNENYGIVEKFNVFLRWRKDGKVLAEKIVDYKGGNHSVSLNLSFTVKRFSDGGDYVCESRLALTKQADHVNDTEEVELLSKLNF